MILSVKRLLPPTFFPKLFFFFSNFYFLLLLYILLYIKHKNFVFRAEFPMGIPNISSFLNISISIRLPHLCQGDNDHCVVTTYDRWMGRLGSGSLMLVFGWGNGGVGIIVFLIFVLFLCSC